MTRETKIGLLVGITFIICFAIILSNRGSEMLRGPTMPYHVLVDRMAKPAVPTATIPERRARDLGRSAVPERKIPATTDRPAPAPDLLAEVENRPADEPEHRAPPSASRGDDFSRFTRRGDPVAVRFRRDVAAAPGPSIPPIEQPIGPVHLTAVDNLIGAGFDPVLPPVAVKDVSGGSSSATRSPDCAIKSPIGQPYVVQKGDTLCKVAKKHYGSAARKVIEVIFAANRDRLPGPDTVRIGQTLILPRLEGMEVTRTGAKKRESSKPPPPLPPSPSPSDEARPPASAPEKDRPKQSEPRKPWRWYEVQKGDIYSTIAQRELGTSKRWKEVFELNKDIFPEPERIRWGVRIRLPSDVARTPVGGSPT